MTLPSQDLLALVKLFKDVFTELSTLRLTVNEIVLDPTSASRLRERVLAEEDYEATRPTLKSRNTSGLGGWISAPISKFFITPPVETSEDDSSTVGSGKHSPGVGASGSGSGGGLAGPTDRGRLHPSRAAPKLAAATASTATTVNVEFASGGAVRRATATTSVAAGPSAAGERPDSPVIRPPSTQGLAPPPSEPTVRAASPTRPSNRANLRGIFAGAASSSSSSGAVPSPTGSWLMAGGAAPAGRLRHAASSSVLRSARAVPITPLGGSPTKRMSSAVDAVLDPSTSTHIYERKLRRTASDESIRSHYLEPAAGPSSLGLGAPPPATSRKPPAAARTVSGGSMFANLSSRLLAFASEGSSASYLAGSDSLDPESISSPTSSSSAGLTPSSLARPSFLAAGRPV